MLFDLENVNKVAFNDMNEVHLEELELANSIYEYILSTKDYDHKIIEQKLEEFTFHLRDHFLFEEDMMRETNCPILSCHQEEHVRVQKIMFQIFTEYARTHDAQLIRFYFEREFKMWIENHILTMDTVTGAFLNDPTVFEGQKC